MSPNGTGTSTSSNTNSIVSAQTKDGLLNQNAAHHRASWSYLCILGLFRMVLRVFYSNIVIEGSEHITPDGTGAIICANHTNSLTDALLLCVTVPRSKRSFLRLTAKDSQFGRRTFTSWLIESAGTLPIKRPKDHQGRKVDNSVVFEKLENALENGDAVCVFPEGMSVYRPAMSGLKQGVARIASDTLARRMAKGDDEYKLAIQCCSITYIHRNLFRSDVLVTFHPPIILTPSTSPGSSLLDPTLPIHEPAIRALTSTIGSTIRSGTLDGPSWQYIRLGNTARRLYAPLGTKLGLGEHVRLTQRFVDAFAGRRSIEEWKDKDSDSISNASAGSGGSGSVPSSPSARLKEKLKTPLTTTGDVKDWLMSGEREDRERKVEMDRLMRDLKTYQDMLHLHGIKDDRVRNPRMSRRRTLFKRMSLRLFFALCLLIISLPGLVLWTPIFVITKKYSEKQKRSGPVFDTYDEVAQTKLVYGLLSGIGVYVVAIIFTLPLAPITIPGVPILMWLTLRWIEDCTSNLRALLALFRLLHIGKRQLIMLRQMREDLRLRVQDVAVKECGLPREGEQYLMEMERKGGKWRGLGVGWFSLQRRRKKDWNETLKLWDVTEYAEDDLTDTEE